MSTRYKDIFKHLKDNGIDVYGPAQKTGACKAPYTVIKSSGSSRFGQFSTTQNFFDVLCYVPQAVYSQLDEYVDKVAKTMKGLEPMIKPTHFRTSSFYDDTVKAHMVSMQYRYYRKI